MQQVKDSFKTKENYSSAELSGKAVAETDYAPGRSRVELY
jgi:hypothetical protein